MHRDCAADCPDQLGGGRRLGQVTEAAVLDHAHRALEAGVTGDHDHGHVEVDLAQRAHEAQAVDAWHVQIGDDSARPQAALDQAQRLGAAGRDFHRETGAREDFCVHLSH